MSDNKIDFETKSENEFLEIQEKWQKRWEEAKVFEANPDNREKFFVNFPYPYINAYQHIGHLFTLMRVEAFARYKRQKGFNVLFPQGWHATGSPIVNAAKRVRDREEKQIKIMADMGITEEAELKKFEEPEYWIEFFAPEFESDFRSLGMSADWRRKFFTTSLNPHYDKFVRWQLKKLKDKGFVIKGKFPVVWDPIELCAVGDHGRSQGEGETPQEFCLFKFKLDDGRYVITATLRPDTVMGITNLYTNPEESYSEVKVTLADNEESWIVGKPIIEKLQNQDYVIEIKSDVAGKELVGQTVESFSGQKIPIFPASFLDSNYGTGMVHSVPSDSADDLIALKNFQEDEETIIKFNLDPEQVKAVTPIGVFETPEIGEFPAEHFLNKYGVKSQNDRKKLDEIKKELYKLTFNCSTYNSKYAKDFSENLEGKLVKDGQEIIKRDLLKQGAIHIFYELTGKVVSRALNECVVKIVDDQWFIDYANPEWKKRTHKCLDQMKLYPEKARDQFNYVIDWLHEWACTREAGLGTRLPWDEKWLIESLSDSTMYTAYYTIAHLIEDVPIEKVDDSLFDYLFLGEEQLETLETEHAAEMRANFEYYYPVDFRNSGKDLIQNHLTFFMFTHTAIFPEDKWPKGIGANGWVTVDGQKMSKSLGNMIPVRDVVKTYGSDVARITILNGGEEMDDPNWDSDFAKSISTKLLNLKQFAIDHYNNPTYRTERKQIDDWFESELNKTIKTSTEAMEKTLFRTAIQRIYFDMQRIVKQYINRTSGDLNKDLMTQFVENQLTMIAPFTPHICEETWEAIGKEDFISLAKYPEADESKINEDLNIAEDYFAQIKADVRKVQELAKIEKLSAVKIFVSEDWKYEFFTLLKEEFEAGNRDFKAIIGKVMARPNLKINGKVITKMIPMFLKKGLPNFVSKEKEVKILEENIPALEVEFDTKIEYEIAEDSTEPKAKQAQPGKPAILVE